MRSRLWLAVAWLNAVAGLALSAACLLSLRWAFVAADANTMIRFHAGTLSYGCYERLRLPTLDLAMRVVDRTPNDYYGSFCHERAVTAPLWPAAISCAALPLLVLARRRRRGRCGLCGYSTRGLPAPVCPECGGDLSDGARTMRP